MSCQCGRRCVHTTTKQQATEKATNNTYLQEIHERETVSDVNYVFNFYVKTKG